MNGGRAPAMRVLLLSDGVAGHDRSSLGILAALSKHRSVQARVLPIREKSRFSRRLKRALAGMLPFALFWKLFYRTEGTASPSNPLPLAKGIDARPVDLLISTGPRTAAANIAVARRLKAKNVYFGNSRWPSDSFYTVLLTSERLKPHLHRAYVLRPSEFDAAELPDPRPLAANGAERQAALLFGGQSKHYAYTGVDMERLAERIVALTLEMPWLRWTLFDSRRTPKAEFERLVDIIKLSGAPVGIVRFADAGLRSNNAAFRADVVLVTADSMSMLAESIAARRPTGILFADAYAPPRRDAIEQQAMLAERRAFALRCSDLSAERLKAGADSLDISRGSQLDALYETLVRRGI